MPRVLIVTEPPVPPEPFRLGLLGLGYNVVDDAVLLSDRTGMVRCGIGYHVDGAAHFHKRRLSRRCARDRGTS